MKSRLDRAVAVCGIILTVLLGALLIEFFIEQGNGGGWVNIGMIMISLFLAVPVTGVTPLWIILLTRKQKSLFSVLIFVLVLILFAVCTSIGWIYPE